MTDSVTPNISSDARSLDERRFGGIERLYGDAGLARLRAAQVIVVGIGGVGSWSAEALARSGVGALTLIDLDVVAESNLNRQAHATLASLGANKIDAMRERILSFAPDCDVRVVDDFVTPENVATLITRSDFVIDAIDQVRAKAALVAHCKAAKIPLVVCGGAGGKTDPTSIRRADLTQTKNDALLSKLRADLRREYGFPRGEKKFGVTAIYSEAQQRGTSSSDGGAGLSCAGYGSAMSMTASIGLAAAAFAIEQIAVPK